MTDSSRQMSCCGPYRADGVSHHPGCTYAPKAIERGTTLKQRIQPTHLGEMLRLYRTVNQHGLREVAKAIGIGHATLMRIEHGEAFDAATLLKLWAYLLQPAATRGEEGR